MASTDSTRTAMVEKMREFNKFDRTYTKELTRPNHLEMRENLQRAQKQ